MGYYEDDEAESYYCYEERIEPVSLVAEGCTEKDIEDALMETGLIQDTTPRLVCSMEKLVFVHGNPNEVYSPAEIRFTERIDKVLVFPDFFKSLNMGSMACRVIAAKIGCSIDDAIKSCISFEKIIDKALDGFNIFFFVTENSVFFGCRVFDKTGKSDCTISTPITSEIVFEQFQEEVSFYTGKDDFLEFYNQFRHTIASSTVSENDYEGLIMKRRGIQLSYLEEIDKIGREIGVDVSREKERYWRQFEEVKELSFSEILEDVEESLSFIKSNRVNTYEMLFEADEMMRQAEEAEAENEKLAVQAALENPSYESPKDTEAEALLDDPEEMIKLLKKRRGL
jgi:hypothetical protein